MPEPEEAAVSVAGVGGLPKLMVKGAGAGPAMKVKNISTLVGVVQQPKGESMQHQARRHT